MDKKDLRGYFNYSKPVSSIFLLVFGILFSVFGVTLSGDFVLAGVGGVLFVAGLYLLIRQSISHSSASVDHYCHREVNDFVHETAQLLLEREIETDESFLAADYCFDKLFSVRHAVRGKDGIMRSSIFAMTCLYFTDEKAYCFVKKISLVSNEKIEYEDEFYLSDFDENPCFRNGETACFTVCLPNGQKLEFFSHTPEDAINVARKVCEKVQQAKLKNMIPN